MSTETNELKERCTWVSLNFVIDLSVFLSGDSSGHWPNQRVIVTVEE